jgi:hypothetical protein
LAKWLYEEGIGESRAALIEDGAIVEARVELPGMLLAGTVADGRLASVVIPGRRGIVLLEGGAEALLEVRVEIVREAIWEPGKPRRAKCRLTDAAPALGASLRERIVRGGTAVLDVPPHGEDQLEAAGWSEVLEAAMSGEIAFEGGALRMSLTPAMTLFDVDGSLPPPALAVAGAGAAARAIRRFGIGGSIGIDLPTLAGKAERLAAAAALDASLPQPFERTAVNGFGFLQVVRRRERASLPEILQSDPVGAATRALLRRAGRASGACTLHAAPAVAARIEARPDWLEALARRIGGAVALRPEPGLAISAGHVHAAHT